jgi:hypothetical protein
MSTSKTHGIPNTVLEEVVTRARENSGRIDIRKAVEQFRKHNKEANEVFVRQVMHLYLKKPLYKDTLPELLCEDSMGHRDTKANFEVSDSHFLNNKGIFERLRTGCLINSYSYDTLRTLSFLSHMKEHDLKEPYMGVEYEMSFNVEDRFKKAKEVYGVLTQDFICIKSDSSIYHGFEMVTAPATLSIQKKYWTRFFDNEEIVKSLYPQSKLGGHGIHVHLSRVSFTDLHLGKFNTFYSSENNRPFLDLMAGRKYSYEKRDLDSGKGNLEGKTMGSRSAINMTKSFTIEVRIFESTDDKVKFFKALEFVHASHAFCRIVHRHKMTSGDFINWLLMNKSNRAKYPYLVQFLFEHVGMKRDSTEYSKLRKNLLSKGVITKSTTDSEVKKFEYDLMLKRKKEREEEKIRKRKELEERKKEMKIFKSSLSKYLLRDDTGLSQEDIERVRNDFSTIFNEEI